MTFHCSRSSLYSNRSASFLTRVTMLSVIIFICLHILFLIDYRVATKCSSFLFTVVEYGDCGGQYVLTGRRIKGLGNAITFEKKPCLYRSQEVVSFLLNIFLEYL